MTDDPLADLRAALVQAAHDRARPRRRRRAILLGAGAAALAVPAAVAATGIGGGDSSRGTFPDRSSFRVTTVPDPRGGAGRCERVEYRDPAGAVAGATTACPAGAAEPAPDGELPTGFSAAPGRVVLLLGRVPRGTVSVDVPDASGAVTLDRDAFRYAAQVPRDRPMLAIARDADGRELARFTAPAMVGR